MRVRPGGRGRGRSGAVLVLAVLLVAAVLGVWWPRRGGAGGVEVFFVRFDADHHRGTLVAVRRPAPGGPIDRRLEAALGGLLDGPAMRRGGGASDLVTEIPAGTALRAVRVAGGTVTVDLSRQYGRGGGSTSMRARVWQVVYTATQFPEGRVAQILIEGRRVAALGGEGVAIGHPLDRSGAPAWF